MPAIVEQYNYKNNSNNKQSQTRVTKINFDNDVNKVIQRAKSSNDDSGIKMS